MWEKLRIRERERALALLFVGILAAVFCYGLLTQGCPNAAQVVGVSILGIFCGVTLWRLVSLLRNRPGAAPVGPLSSNEKLKARSKLLKGGSRTILPN
jgi:hypothetical protein